jgi:hypothetical protein
LPYAILSAVAVKRRTQSRLERGVAADLWRHTLSQIPSIFGRLAYLASLRDSNTGRYEHHGLALVYGDDESHRTLLASHEKAFSDWLSFDLENQKADLSLYFSGLSNDPGMIVDNWNKLDFHKYLVPSTASPTQRELYAADLEAVLQLFNGSSRRQAASQRL